MRIDAYLIVAPRLTDAPFNQTEAFGAACWLCAQSPLHQQAPVAILPRLLLPAIASGQFVLVYHNDQPINYMSWALFSIKAEHHYLHQLPLAMPPSDWHSGTRLWLLDWIAPFGHTAQVSAMMRRYLFPARIGRALYHRGRERGLRIKHFFGKAVLPHEGRTWLALHPPAWELIDE